MSGPLTSVLDAIAGGAGSYGEICSATGLSREIVTASVDHLVRTGRLEVATLALGCPGGGCSSCASADDGRPGCGAAAPSASRRGAVLTALTLKRR